MIIETPVLNCAWSLDIVLAWKTQKADQAIWKISLQWLKVMVKIVEKGPWNIKWKAFENIENISFWKF